MNNVSELVHAVQTLNADDGFRPRFSLEQWHTLGPYLTRHELKAGELLIKQGDTDRTMYLLERGSLQVFVTRTVPGAQRIAIQRTGAVVGEAGLIGEGPRMANVEAMTPCVVWALRGPRLEELAARLPTLAYEVMRATAAVLAARLRAAIEKNVPVS